MVHRFGRARRFAFYAAAVIGGVGGGIVYGAMVGQALKWFPDKRGLAAGLTAGGYGAGAAVTIVPMAQMIEHSGFSNVLVFGIVQGGGRADRSAVARAAARAR